MALFEYDQGHLIPAQFGRPVSCFSEEEVLLSVRRQVLEVIARPLFPVTWMDTAPAPQAGDGQASAGEHPRLTALDASGQVVSIEVLQTLDAATLISALARLGQASALGWNELAAAYPGGIGAFRAGWTQFRDSMPPRQDPGPRLILVAAAIDPDVRPALGALAASGLEVHQLSVREMSNGRKFLDVQRLHSTLFGHEPNVLSGRAARVPELSTAVDAIGAGPVQDFEQAVSAPEPAAEPAPAPEQQPEAPAEETVQTGSISRRSILEAARQSPAVPPAPDDTDPRAPQFEPVAPSHAAAPDSTPPLGNAVLSDEEVQAALLHHDPQGLATLAGIVGNAIDLHWPELGAVAVLALDGTINLEGRSFTDPSALCADLGHADLDGWNVWHMGEKQGPTLAEACAEMNAEIRRSLRR